MDRNEQLKRQFVREVRIGMALIGIVLTVFIAVVYHKVSGRYQREIERDMPANAADTPGANQSTGSAVLDNRAALQAAILPMIDQVEPKAGDTSPTKAPPMPAPQTFRPSSTPLNERPVPQPATSGDPSARITIEGSWPSADEQVKPAVVQNSKSITTPSPFQMPSPTNSDASTARNQSKAVDVDSTVDAAVAQASFEADVEPSSAGSPTVIYSRPMRAVRIAPGESLWKIALREYGDGRVYRALAAFNQFDRLPPGTRIVGSELLLPDVQTLREQFGALLPQDLLSRDADVPAGSETSDSHEHVTADGETLFSIARDRLGQASRYLEILELNQPALPEETTAGSKLPAGIRLALPKE